MTTTPPVLPHRLAAPTPGWTRQAAVVVFRMDLEPLADRLGAGA